MSLAAAPPAHYHGGMRRLLRCVFVGLLSVALAASGATLGLAWYLGSHATGAEHAHHSLAHDASAHGQPGHHAHDHSAQTLPGESPAAHDHPSKKCCSACTLISPLPGMADATVPSAVSCTVYSVLASSGAAVALPIDPGIPKCIS